MAGAPTRLEAFSVSTSPAALWAVPVQDPAIEMTDGNVIPASDTAPAFNVTVFCVLFVDPGGKTAASNFHKAGFPLIDGTTS